MTRQWPDNYRKFPRFLNRSTLYFKIAWQLRFFDLLADKGQALSVLTRQANKIGYGKGR